MNKIEISKCEGCNHVRLFDNSMLTACVHCNEPQMGPPEITNSERYVRKCWVYGCNGYIDSDVSKLSTVHKFGFCCKKCGADLGGYLVQLGIITLEDELYMRDYFKHNNESNDKLFPHWIYDKIDNYINYNNQTRQRRTT